MDREGKAQLHRQLHVLDAVQTALVIDREGKAQLQTSARSKSCTDSTGMDREGKAQWQTFLDQRHWHLPILNAFQTAQTWIEKARHNGTDICTF
jgi:hypothetical protein